MRGRAVTLALMVSAAAFSAVLALGIVPAFCGAGPAADAGLEAAIGKALFKRVWLPAPSSTKANDGLGPLFNARSCLQCHAAATAGRLELSQQGELIERGAVVRLSTDAGEPDAVYGAQIQPHAIPGHRPEAMVRVTWILSQVKLADGTTIQLRKPGVHLEGLGFGRLASGVKASLLLAPSLKVAAQIARVDPAARDGNAHTDGANKHTGIFGHKANEVALEGAISTAFARDLGLSTLQHPRPAGDCTPLQTACTAGPHGGDGTGIEIAPQIVSAVVAYVKSLPAPSSRPADTLNAGAQTFADAGCAACHLASLPAANGQAVTLFSDLAVHGMGEGLSGVAGDGTTANEWRTAPLVGIAERLAAGSTLLHDGRARSLPEAVLWHGGAAQNARDAYARLTVAERAALESYVLSR